MNLFVPFILVLQLFGGFMETKLAEDMYLNTWQVDGYAYAQICNNGKYGSKHITKATPDDYISIKAISPNYARATYSDGTTKLLHVVDGCITVMEEGEKKQ